MLPSSAAGLVTIVTYAFHECRYHKGDKTFYKRGNMLQITDTTKEKLQGILEGQASKYLRVYVQGMG